MRYVSEFLERQETLEEIQKNIFKKYSTSNWLIYTV